MSLPLSRESPPLDSSPRQPEPPSCFLERLHLPRSFLLNKEPNLPAVNEEGGQEGAALAGAGHLGAEGRKWGLMAGSLWATCRAQEPLAHTASGDASPPGPSLLPPGAILVGSQEVGGTSRLQIRSYW